MRQSLRGSLLIAVLAATLSAPGTHAEDAAAPEIFLDLDTGGHRAFIKDMAVSADGRFVFTASDDKTVRMWDVQSGRTERVFRGWRAEGQAGKVFAVAVSPDGKTLAAAGWFGPDDVSGGPYGDIRLFETRTGRVLSVIHDLGLPVYDLAFTADGGKLMAGGQDGYVTLYAPGADGAWSALASLDTGSGHIEKIAMLAGGRVVATTDDVGVVLFDDAAMPMELPDGDALAEAPQRGLVVAPDGRTFATGGDDGAVRLWNADGTLARAFDALPFLVGSLAFTLDGKALVATCGYGCLEGPRAVALSVTGGERLWDYAGIDGTVYAAAALPGTGQLAIAGGMRNEIHLLDPATGARTAVFSGRGAPVTAAGITAGGDEIAWGSVNPCPAEVACPETLGALEFRLKLPTPDRNMEHPEAAPAEGTWRRAVFAEGDWSLKGRKGGEADLDYGELDILNGAGTAGTIGKDATTGYLHSAYSLLAGGERLVTGGNDGVLFLHALADGKALGELRGGHAGEINAVAEAPGAGLLLTASADQTLALWNGKTGELIVNAFFAGKEWILWTPQGYYYSSPGGDDFFGWHINGGSDEAGRFVKARQLKTYLNSPEIIRRAIILKSAKQAVKELRGTDTELQRLLMRKPPDFAARIADNQAGEDRGVVAVEIALTGDPDEAPEEFSVLSNDRRIATSRSVSADGKSMIIEVPVAEGENDIRITGLNEFGYMTERSVKAIGKKKSGAQKRGTLYVLVVGAEDYPLLPDACGGRSCNLRYPVDDAAAFLDTVVARTGPLYEKVEARLIVNRDRLDETPALAEAARRIVGDDNILEPEAGTIEDELADFLEKPGPDDTTIVFLAGHGVNVDEDYYFIPSNGKKRDAEKWQRTSLVQWEDIQTALEDAEGRRIMMVDTCHAANAFNARMEKDAIDARIFVFSATDANNTAAELETLGHGVFTFAVLEGLKGKASMGGDGVRLLPLASYVDAEVRKLTADRQVPRWYFAETDNFLIAAQ